MLIASRLLTERSFRHGFSTREVDLSPRSGALAVDRARIAGALGVPPDALLLVSQVHGADVADAAAVKREAPPQADALVARAGLPRIAIGVRVADCVPILVGDPDGGGVASIHAGWRGLVRGVVGNAIARMDAAPGRLVAAIGPSICAACFEVGGDVAREIADACGTMSVIGPHPALGKAYVDLRLGVRTALLRAGLNDPLIEDVPGCTMHEPLRFFSYRRDGDRSGRHVAAISPLT